LENFGRSSSQAISTKAQYHGVSDAGAECRLFQLLTLLQRAADFKKEAEIKIDVGKYPFHQRKYLVTAFEKLLGGQILHSQENILGDQAQVHQPFAT
jgi:hypothetical protein